MGHRYRARCIECRNEFEVNEGGGFVFHLLRCNKCGFEKVVDFDDIGEPHHQYLLGLRAPYSMATVTHDKHVKGTYRGTPLSEKDYHKAIEKIAGGHECGGHFRFKAPPRCTKCLSKKIECVKPLEMYD